MRGCAVASVEPHAGTTVWGVMYEMTADDLARLDAREGYDPVNLKAVNRYDRVEIVIERLRGEPVQAVTYIALPEPQPGLPSLEYMKHIIDGAVAHSFPEDYVSTLKAFPVDTEV